MQAKSNNGSWHLRIEDLDPPREEKGAKDKILKTLDFYQLHWDQKVVYQSRRLDKYQEVLNLLIKKNKVFNCACSRKNLKPDNVYPGTCRKLKLAPENTAVRLKTRSQTIKINDLAHGSNNWNLEQDVGDFIIKRKDGLFSYQLAVVVDDEELGVTEVIRGMDLFDETPKQIFLQQLLHYHTPNYGHVPIATHVDGDKLSKQTHAPELELDEKSAAKNIYAALIFLKQTPPKELATCQVSELWQWAIANWDIARAFSTS